MSGTQRYGATPNYNESARQRIGNDSAYGSGSDGTVVIASNTSLTRDMYYENLTVNNGVTLNPNGFRIFVKNTLTLNGTIGVSASTSVSDGTVKGNAPKATSTTNSIGGSAYGSTYTASQMSSSLLYDMEKAVFGTYILPSGTVTIAGGAGGGDGSPGTVTPGTNGSGATSGGAGGSGGAGYLPSKNPGTPGGPGTNGTSGTSGSNGVAGSTPPAAAAGAGAKGGPVVIVVAKNVSGSGSIISQGQNSTAGGSSATGSGATNGAAGSPGSAGSAAPGLAVSFYSDNHAHYITGDGTHGPHASKYTAIALPHGSHTPSDIQHLHNDRYVWHAVYVTPCGDGTHNHGAGHYHTNYGHHHGYSPHDASEDGSRFHHQGSIPHSHSHRNQPGVAYSYYHHYQYNHSGYNHGDGHWHTGAMQCSDWKGHHFHTPRHHGSRVGHGGHAVQRNAGTVSHVGHLHAAGGSAGAAGAAGSAGTNGTNGSTTAGTDGQAGGGGGIIIVTDAALPVGITTSVIGGTVNSKTGSSGMLVTILNT